MSGTLNELSFVGLRGTKLHAAIQAKVECKIENFLNLVGMNYHHQKMSQFEETDEATTALISGNNITMTVPKLKYVLTDLTPLQYVIISRLDHSLTKKYRQSSLIS